MSGTSLDGIDLCYCCFSDEGRGFSILASSTYNYSDDWKERLKNAIHLSGEDLTALDSDLASLFASVINAFIEEKKIKKLDAIASHGHTVFHQPHKQFTLQIGSGAYVAALTKNKVISDFRSADVVLGGQGAPLVPIGDRDLFKDYSNRLNLGGFGNISFEKGGLTLAFDICPVNMALNEMASHFNLSYDEDGAIARSGEVNEELFDRLNSLAYYREKAPKSLGAEWYLNVFKPVLIASNVDAKDKLRTLVEHIAYQLTNCFVDGNVLLSGGGAHNSFLVERIKANSANQIIIPDSNIIDYKEALVFAYLAYLRLQNKNNVLASVTGAIKDHCAGSIHC
jgi:anhydro-N-acetylmuramic acid kinase